MENDSSYGQILRLPKRKLSARQNLAAPAERPVLTDVFPSLPTDPAATGFVLALLRDADGPILWVQDYLSRQENGQLYTPGLRALGVDHAVLQVTVSHPRDVLWAMEEGAACAGLSAVIGEIYGGPAALSFVATKRLALRAEGSGVPVYLIRSGDPGGLSAARARWRVASIPSEPHAHDTHSPGHPQWEAELFRARGRPPGRWIARHDPKAVRTADRFRLVPRPDDGTVEADDVPVSDRSGG
ncbi:hypothetical protein [Aestuariivita sp.]|jgi:protein ImuA|uniref:ImuA family protein n=1 Tax=Aestuariivita sp. TaxID=1872407 RepID=UPI002174A0A4|nr:hypothetical protein [Aestuariivita sp.]MCE8007764.1 hypothetical protein [Aestuariivita sp.]